jgi:hypothetical protein
MEGREACAFRHQLPRGATRAQPGSLQVLILVVEINLFQYRQACGTCQQIQMQATLKENHVRKPSEYFPLAVWVRNISRLGQEHGGY